MFIVQYREDKRRTLELILLFRGCLLPGILFGQDWLQNRGDHGSTTTAFSPGSPINRSPAAFVVL